MKMCKDRSSENDEKSVHRLVLELTVLRSLIQQPAGSPAVGNSVIRHRRIMTGRKSLKLEISGRI
jgi:hypothetical protein